MIDILLTELLIFNLKYHKNLTVLLDVYICYFIGGSTTLIDRMNNNLKTFKLVKIYGQDSSYYDCSNLPLNRFGNKRINKFDGF
jgi:hypothetical protein